MRWFYLLAFLLITPADVVAEPRDIKNFLSEAKKTCNGLGLAVGTKENAICVINLVKIQKDNRIKYHEHKEKIISVLEKIDDAGSKAAWSNAITTIVVGTVAAAATQGIVQGVNSLNSSPPPTAAAPCVVGCSPPSVIDLQNFGVLPRP